MSATPTTAGDQPKRAPTLFIIAGLKIVKGSLLLLTALGIYALAGRDLGDLFDQFLVRVHMDPERRFFVDIGDRLSAITPASMQQAELGTLLYGLILFAGGIGLSFRAHWAVWLAIGESAFFIPIEIFELVRRHVVDPTLPPVHHGMLYHPKVALLIVLAINLLIVVYLLKNRSRIFRDHH